MAPMLAGVILGVLYGVLLIYLTVQMGIMLKERHRVMSFKFGFNALCFVWNLMRVAFWIVEAGNYQVPLFWSFFLWWSPHAIMYATFALLAMFFAKLTISDSSWRNCWRRRCVAALAITTALDAVNTALWISVAVEHSGDQTAQNSEAFTTGSVFLVLGGLFFFFGCRVLKMGDHEANRLFVSGPRVTAAINFLLFVIFVSRSTFNYLTSTGVVVVYITGNQPSTVATVVAVFVLWELLPTVVLLATIARGKRGRTIREPLFGRFAVQTIQQSPRQAQRQGLMTGFLPPLPESISSGSTAYGTSRHDQRRGSVGDDIAQGDARFGTFQTNIFGASPRWYGRSDRQYNPPPSTWQSDRTFRSDTDEDFGASPPLGDTLTIESDAHNQPQQQRRLTARDRFPSGGLVDVDATATAGSVRTGSAADTSVFANPHRYDTPPTDAQSRLHLQRLSQQ